MLKPKFDQNATFQFLEEAPEIGLQCPHCLRENTAFRISSYTIKEINKTAYQNYVTITSLWICKSCNSGVVIEFQNIPDNQPIVKGLDFIKCCIGYKVFPKVEMPTAPQYTPPEIAKHYTDGVEHMMAGYYDSCAFKMRKVLDLATNEKLENNRKDPLWKKIDILSESGSIALDLAKWATWIRLIGNDAVHGADDANGKELPFTEQDAIDIKSFTEMFLIYIYQLPKMLEACREASKIQKKFPDKS
jgi:hypothetical protein